MRYVVKVHHRLYGTQNLGHYRWLWIARLHVWLHRTCVAGDRAWRHYEITQ